MRNNTASHSLDQSTTVQHRLKQAGYRTGLFGKYLNAWTLADAQELRRRRLRALLSVDDAVQAVHDKLAALGQW
ncbi:hypothetical protein [Streptomyces nojiriensis]|uniref:hypothetical protein n=1 Tax=Streptomyces nojiriensis TaxID=66374 RepID=UPI003667E3F4